MGGMSEAGQSRRASWRRRPPLGWAPLPPSKLVQEWPARCAPPQRSLAGPWSADAAGGPGHFTLQMLELSLREEELRAQHQTALLRLREKALEEKMCAELAWLEQQRA